jgi:hypothetical protein
VILAGRIFPAGRSVTIQVLASSGESKPPTTKCPKQWHIHDLLFCIPLSVNNRYKSPKFTTWHPLDFPPFQHSTDVTDLLYFTGYQDQILVFVSSVNVQYAAHYSPMFSVFQFFFLLISKGTKLWVVSLLI